MITVDIQGATELALKMQNSVAFMRRETISAMQDSNEIVVQGASIYPPETEANFPPPPFYIRGVGTQISDTLNLNESEQLGTRWVTDINATNKGVIGEIDNTASYAPFVHGRQGQKAYHAGRGWRKVTAIVKQSRSRILDRFNLVALRVAAFIQH